MSKFVIIIPNNYDIDHKIWLNIVGVGDVRPLSGTGSVRHSVAAAAATAALAYSLLPGGLRMTANWSSVFA